MLITDEKRNFSLSEILHNITNLPPRVHGCEYIKAIALNFAVELDFKFLSIGKTSDHYAFFIENEVHVLDKKVQSNLSFEIKEQGLKAMMEKRVFSLDENFAEMFYDKNFLEKNKIKTMIGAPILCSENKLVGFIYALSDKPIENSAFVSSIFEFIAARVSVEFERMQNQDQARKMNTELEEIIELRTFKLRNALDELNRKEQQLELRYHENVNMLRMLSHDLSNPLQVLSMSIESLQDRAPAEYSRILERMKRSTDTISQILFLVRELQAFSAGKKELKIEPVCLDEIIEKSKFSFQDKLKEKNISLNYIVKNCPSPKVLAEKISLCNNVFNNLISNAIKFSDPNSTIDITIEQANDKILVSVIDHGIGIPKELLPDLFAYNRETTRPGTKGEKGTGFGLPLVKLFLDLYNVQVSVSSVTKEEDINNHGTSIDLIFQKAS